MSAQANDSEGQASGTPPSDLPRDPRRFWSAAVNLDDLAPPEDVDTTPVLKRLGPLPFARRGFPVMGFLATVYDHVTGHAKEAMRGGEHHSDRS